MQTEEIKEFEETKKYAKYYSKPYAKGQLRAVYTMGLANFLIDRGFMIRRVSLNNQDRNSTVFFFDNTDELQEFIQMFLNVYLNTNE